jgi:hypothetical protein
MAGSLATSVGTYLRQSSAPAQSVALTLPLLCLYGLGILISPGARNGVDFVTQMLFAGAQSVGIAGGAAYLGFYGLLIAVNFGLIAWLRRSQQWQPRYLVPLLLECVVYAVATGVVSSAITRDLALSTAAPSFGVFDGLVVSAGAGLHEELLFRLGMFGLPAWLWLGKDWRRPSRGLLLLWFASSVLFSLAHYLGPENFAMTSFIYRTVSGLLFGALFALRGFAVAAWTHALYDVWVIVVLGH